MIVINIGLILILFRVAYSNALTYLGTEDKYPELLVRLKEGLGLVQGQYETTTWNKTYASFYGIPFAKPPTRDLRFKDPLPLASWNGILKADKQRDVCIQLDSTKGVIGSEDCLYLNIFSPSINGNKLPVMVYIHGGAFISGTPVIKPDVLLENNILVAAITYRVGVIGFLSLDTEEVPGNAGLKDQSLALKWIKQHIGQFGGDENNISIFGLSAGGSSVNNHQLSPMSRGLFNKVIAMSGTWLTPWGIQRNPQKMVAELTNILNITAGDINLLEKLQDININYLIQSSHNVLSDPDGFSEEPSFGPVIENYFKNKASFFDKDPMEYVTDRSFYDVPVMFGHTSKEYLSFTNKDQTESLIVNNITVVPKRWRSIYSKIVIKKLANTIKDYYFKGINKVDFDDTNSFERAINVLSDITFIMPTIDTVRIQVASSKSDIYHYRFSYKGRLNNEKIDNYDLNGATHGDDVRYLFVNESPRVEDESPEGKVRRRLARIFVNFARKGNPNQDISEPCLNVYWPPVTNKTHNYLEINDELLPCINPEEDRRIFWKTLEEKLIAGNI